LAPSGEEIDHPIHHSLPHWAWVLIGCGVVALCCILATAIFCNCWRPSRATKANKRGVQKDRRGRIAGTGSKTSVELDLDSRAPPLAGMPWDNDPTVNKDPALAQPPMSNPGLYQPVPTQPPREVIYSSRQEAPAEPVSGSFVYGTEGTGTPFEQQMMNNYASQFYGQQPMPPQTMPTHQFQMAHMGQMPQTMPTQQAQQTMIPQTMPTMPQNGWPSMTAQQPTQPQMPQQPGFTPYNSPGFYPRQ
jgi:hypothetical protein